MEYSRLIWTDRADARRRADAHPATAHRRTILAGRRSTVLARAVARLRGPVLDARPAGVEPRSGASGAAPCGAARA